MSIIYDPREMLNEVAPDAKIKRLVRGRLSVKRSALSFLNDVPFLNKSAISRVALKTVKQYQQRVYKTQIDEDREASLEERKEIIDDPALLINRVQNAVLYQIGEEIQAQYGDEMAEWLPSDADEPDPVHQSYYGKTFLIRDGMGPDGDFPGRRYGCKCGLRILTKETELKLD